MDRPVLTDVLPGLGQKLRGLELDIVPDRVLADPDDAHELRVDPGLLHHLANRGLRHGLALLDAAAGHDCGELGFVGEVEDEQLVEPRFRVLARDVGGDRRARSQLFWARILAL